MVTDPPTRFLVSLTAIAIGVIGHELRAQPEIQWQQPFLNANWGNCPAHVCRTAHETYVLAGIQGDSIGIVCVDAKGRPIWQRRHYAYDPPYRDAYSEVYSLQVLRDGGFALAGMRSTSLQTPDKDAWILRLDSLGILVWKRTFGQPGYTPSDTLCEAWCVREARNGDLLLAGNLADSSWVCRLDPQGNSLWSYRYAQGATIRALIELPAGGIVAFGYSVLRIDDNGKELWWADYKGGYGGLPCAAMLSPNGNLLVLQTKDLPPVMARLTTMSLLTCMDTSGNALWERPFGDSVGYDALECFAQAPGLGYVLAGSQSDGYDPSTTQDGRSRLWIVRTDPSGDTLWTYTSPTMTLAHSIVATQDSGYVVAAELTNSSVFNRTDLIKMSDHFGASVKPRVTNDDRFMGFGASALSVGGRQPLFDLRGRRVGRYPDFVTVSGQLPWCAGIYIARHAPNQYRRIALYPRQ